MFCTKCGKELSGEMQFCPKCGTAVVGELNSRIENEEEEKRGQEESKQEGHCISQVFYKCEKTISHCFYDKIDKYIRPCCLDYQ